MNEFSVLSAFKLTFEVEHKSDEGNKSINYPENVKQILTRKTLQKNVQR